MATLDPSLLDEMEPRSTDIAYRVINTLFDSHNTAGAAVEGNISSGMASLLAEQASIFNSVVIVAMAAMISLSLATSLVQSNYDGVPFGKLVHTIWGPVRIAIAVLALAPMPGMDGFSVIQNMVIKASYASVGLASYQARKGIDRIGIVIEEGTELDGRSEFLMPQIEEVAQNVLNMAILGYYAESRRYKDEAIANGQEGREGIRAWRSKMTSEIATNGATLPSFVSYSTSNATAFTSADGSVANDIDIHVFKFNIYNRQTHQTQKHWYGDSAGNKKDAYIGSASMRCSPTVLSAVACENRAEQLRKIITTMSVAAAVAVYNEVDYRTAREQSDDLKAGISLPFKAFNLQAGYQALLAVQQQYRLAGIQAGALKAKTKLVHTTIKERIEKDGFAMLGSTHISLSHILEDISSMAGDMPRSGLSRYGDGSKGGYLPMLKYYADQSIVADNAIQFENVARITKRAGAIYIDPSKEEQGLAGDEEGSFNALVNKFAGAPFNLVGNPMRVDIGEDPLLNLQSYGHTLIAAIEVGGVAAVLAKAAKDAAIETKRSADASVIGGAALAVTGGAALAGFSGSIFESVFGLLKYFFMLLLVPALAMAYYLPFVPMLLWTIALAGLFIHMIEAIVAAPIWAAAHASTEGDGLMGVHARAGYMLVLGLFLRPPLMVFSFFVSFEMMDVMIHLFNGLFDVQNRALSAGTIMGIVSWVAMIYLYTLTIIVIEHKIFGLVTWLPDNAINWAGQTMGRSLGHEAEGAVSKVGGMANRLPGAGGGAGGGTGNAALGDSAARGARDKKFAELGGGDANDGGDMKAKNPSKG